MLRLKRIVIWLVIPQAIVCGAAVAILDSRTAPEPEPVGPKAGEVRSDPSPIFRCIGAGAGVVVSLGGDGSSVFVWCDKVNP